jgi:hypothetical protein
MKCQLLFFLILTYLTLTFQLLKRIEKAEGKTDLKNIKENLNIKESIENLNQNDIIIKKEQNQINNIKEKV